MTAADSGGRTVLASSIYTVSAPRAATPRLSKVKQAHRRWREGRRLATVSRATVPVGTTFSFTLSRRARVTLTFIRSGRHPVKSKLTLSARAGANRIGFQGRLSKKRRLAPGSYKVLIARAA